MCPQVYQSKEVKPSQGAVSTPNKWPSREHFQGTVTLIIESEKKSYTLHKDLLCYYSHYFRAAFQGSFKEAIEGEIELPEVTKYIFEHFQVWLYTRRLDIVTLSFGSIVRLWIFGDKHQIPLLQNCAMDAMFDKFIKQKHFAVSMISTAYDNTPAGSLLRKAVIGIASSLDLQSSRKPHLDSVWWSVESLIDLVRAVASRPKALPESVLPKRDKCFFHVYGEDEHC